MSRPSEPRKKEILVERCLAIAIKTGTLDSSINEIAEKIGTSGRMLVYHFGSKNELERQIISLLETRLQEKLWSFQSLAIQETDRPVKPFLEMWEHLTSPDIHGLLKLTMELNQRAMQGDAETRQFLEQEHQKWITTLSQLLNNEDIALSLFHLFQGAVMDFLTTGNAQRGRRAIRAFLESLELRHHQAFTC
jgi:AcrR family transcriptional regulator